MPRLKLTLEYDGTAYVGWQVQPNGLSVQQVVEDALARLVGEKVVVSAAGRTDAGVHAVGQVVSFWTDKRLPLRAWVRGLGGLLPEDVSVVDALEVPDDFEPRRWSLGKHYRYQVCNRPVRAPLLRHTHWQIFAPLELGAMQQAATHLLGRHDFSAFRAADCAARHALRELRALEVHGDPGSLLRFEVKGTAFLKHMVRNLVGTLVEVGRGRRPPGWVAEVLASRDRHGAGPTAPAHGLCLMEVYYGDGPRPR
jgi:tRNA pseudouridine38-40 synthase